MTQQERTAEIIIQLKQIKEEQFLSLQDIQNLVADAGEFTSLSSIKRVFAEGSETQNFRYQDTIQPIARALLKLKKQTESPVSVVETEALKNVALLKDSIIRDLRSENESLTERLRMMEESSEKRLEAQRIDFQKKVDYLISENKRKDKIVITRNRVIAAVTIAFGLFMMLVIGVLVIDLNNPNVGWFRDLAAGIIGG